MNKAELVEAIAEKTESTKKQSEQFLDAVLEIIQDQVVKGEKVVLVGFGSFEAKERKERVGRNPATGKELRIPATRVPAFSAGKVFKNRVSEN